MAIIWKEASLWNRSAQIWKRASRSRIPKGAWKIKAQPQNKSERPGKQGQKFWQGENGFVYGAGKRKSEIRTIPKHAFPGCWTLEG